MGAIFTKLLGTASSIFGGIWGYAAVAVVAGGIAVYGTHHWDQVALDALKLKDADAQTAAVQAAKDALVRQDKITLDAAVNEAEAQQKIVTQTVTVQKEILIHVPDDAHCLTYGLVRLLDRAALGPDATPFAPGQPDDGCAPIPWRLFAERISDDYGHGRQNAEQLNALIDWNRKQAAQH